MRRRRCGRGAEAPQLLPRPGRRRGSMPSRRRRGRRALRGDGRPSPASGSWAARSRSRRTWVSTWPSKRSSLETSIGERDRRARRPAPSPAGRSGGRAGQLDGDARGALAETLQDRREQAAPADWKVRTWMVPASPAASVRRSSWAAPRCEDRARVLDEDGRRPPEADRTRAAGSLDELGADRALERADLLRDGRLGVPEALTRAREGARAAMATRARRWCMVDACESITFHDRNEVEPVWTDRRSRRRWAIHSRARSTPRPPPPDRPVHRAFGPRRGLRKDSRTTVGGTQWPFMAWSRRPEAPRGDPRRGDLTER